MGRGPAGRDLHRALARRHKRALWPHNITTSTECLLGSEPSKAWTLQRYGRCFLSSSSLRSELLPLTGPSSATGSGTSTLRRRQGVMSDHSAILGGASIVANLQTVCDYAAQGGAINRLSAMHVAPTRVGVAVAAGDRGDQVSVEPDGTLKGLQVGTILSDGCATQGTVYRTPFVATRTGDVATSVIVADPALFAAPTAPAAPPPRAGR